MKTGQNIKTLRKQHNLRQLELAEQIGYGAYQQTVSLWESNKATPTFEQAKKMAAIFQVPISEICDEYSYDPKQIIPNDGIAVVSKDTVLDYLDWDQKQGNQSIKAILISLSSLILGLGICELAKYGVPGIAILPIYIALMIVALHFMKKVGLKKEVETFSIIESGDFHLDDEAEAMVKQRKEQLQASVQATGNMGTFGILLLLMWFVDSGFDAGWVFSNSMVIIYLVGFGLILAMCMPTLNYWYAIRKLLHESLPKIQTPFSKTFWKN